MITMTDAADHPLDFAERAMRQGREVAIATLIACPPVVALRVGQQMAVDEDDAIAGSMGNERIEAAIVARARAVIASGAPETIDLDGSGAPASPEDAATRVYIERVG